MLANFILNYQHSFLSFDYFLFYWSCFRRNGKEKTNNRGKRNLKEMYAQFGRKLAIRKVLSTIHLINWSDWSNFSKQAQKKQNNNKQKKGFYLICTGDKNQSTFVLKRETFIWTEKMWSTKSNNNLSSFSQYIDVGM